MNNPDSGHTLERNNLILALLGTLASVYFQDRALTLSFVAGALLTLLNLRLWRRIVQALTAPKRVSKGKLILRVILKFAGGLGGLAVIMLVFHPQPVAFLLGLSTVVVAVVLEGVLGVFREEAEETAPVAAGGHRQP